MAISLSSGEKDEKDDSVSDSCGGNSSILGKNLREELFVGRFAIS